MQDHRSTFAFVIATALLALVPGHAAASVQRTFVASTGNDANPCSLTLPCRTFAAAIDAVAPSGEVVVLDSAGYGPVTIAKSVSIIAPPGVYAGVTATTTDGITVSGANVNVILRGLTVHGLGSLVGSGLEIISGGLIEVENCEISGFGAGIDFAASSTAELRVSDTVVRSNFTGMFVRGAGVASPAYVTISRSRIDNNVDNGIDVANAIVAVADSVISGSSSNMRAAAIPNTDTRVALDHMLISRGSCGLCIGPASATGGKVQVAIMNSTISGNLGYGIEVGGTGTTCTLEAIVTRTQVTHNGGGIQVDGSGCAAQVWIDGAAVFENSEGSVGAAEVTVANNGKLYTRQNNTIADITVTTGGSVVSWPAQ